MKNRNNHKGSSLSSTSSSAAAAAAASTSIMNIRTTKIASSRNSNILHRFRLRNNINKSKLDDFLNDSDYEDDDNGNNFDKKNINNQDKYYYDHDKTNNEEKQYHEAATLPVLPSSLSSSSSSLSSSTSSPFKKGKGLKRFMNNRNRTGTGRSQYESLESVAGNTCTSQEGHVDHRHPQQQQILASTHSAIVINHNNHADMEKEGEKQWNLQQHNNKYNHYHQFENYNDETKRIVLNEIHHNNRNHQQCQLHNENEILMTKKKRKSLDSVESNQSLNNNRRTLPEEQADDTMQFKKEIEDDKSSNFEMETTKVENFDHYEYCVSAADNYDDGFDNNKEKGSLLKKSKNMKHSRHNDNAPFDTLQIPSMKSRISETTDDSLLSPSYSPTDRNCDSSFYFNDDDEVEEEAEEEHNTFHNLNKRVNTEEEYDEEETGDDDDDCDSSCASTVVNDKPPRVVRPPPSATKEEQAKFYWELCYGKETNMNLAVKSWSASRKAPTKSCLSAKKTQWSEIAQSSSKRSTRRNHNLNSSNRKSTPTTCDHFKFEQDGKCVHNPSPPVGREGVNASNNGHDTPNIKTPQNNNDGSDVKSVKFGFASAAEFESSRPTVELTPLPTDKARERFPVEERDDSSDDGSTEMHRETARNAERLALWDADFDDFLDNDIAMDDDCSDNEDYLPRTSTSSRDRRDDRRSSIFYSKNGGSLLEKNIRSEKHNYNVFQDWSENENYHSRVNEDDMIRFSSFSQSSQQIVSPNSATYRLSSESGTSRTNSLEFSSPSISGSLRLSTSDSDVSKITPTAAMQSSSSLLRSVHSEGGASVGRNHLVCHDDFTQDLKPSQLDNTLRQAECINSRLQMNIKKSNYHSLINRIINSDLATNECDENLNTMLCRQFGLLLQERSNYFGSSYHIAISALLNNILNKIEVHSQHLLISNAICQSLHLKSYPEATINKQDLSEILQISISFLEKEILTMDECDSRMTRALAGLVHQNFESSNRTALYSALIETAMSNWEYLETEALQTAFSCFQLVHESNCEEQAKLKEFLSNISHSNSQETKTIVIRSDLQAQIRTEMKTLREMENEIYEHEKELDMLYPLSSLYAMKVEVEMDCPLVAIDYFLLNQILTFNQNVLMLDQIELSYPHFDEDSSSTILCWSSKRHFDREKRQSINSLDSAMSAEDMIDLLTTTPSIRRTKNVRNAYSEYRYLPKGSAAYKLYTAILDSGFTTKFISNCFKEEQETGILILSDIFQRLNLLAMDVMELHKYYSCRVDKPLKSASVMLNVTISLGLSFSIGIRFTYDLSNDRTILYSIPSDVFIFPITGEPSVPINILLRLAKKVITNGPISNAYMLKRICSSVVGALQGRDF